MDEKATYRRALDRQFVDDDDDDRDDAPAANDDEPPPVDDAAEDTPADDATDVDDATGMAAATSDDPPTDDGVTDDSAASNDVAPTAGGSIDDCVLQVFASSCSDAACHAVFPPNLVSEDTFDVLTTGTPLCTSTSASAYVDLTNPDQSYLLLKIRGEQPSGCGTEMPPPTAAQLGAAQLQCLEDWIASLGQ